MKPNIPTIPVNKKKVKYHLVDLAQKMIQWGIPLIVAIVAYAHILRPLVFIHPVAPGTDSNIGYYTNSVLALFFGVVSLGIISSVWEEKNREDDYSVLFWFFLFFTAAATIVLQVRPGFLQNVGLTELANNHRAYIDKDMRTYITWGITALSAILGFAKLRQGIKLGIIISALAMFITGMRGDLGTFMKISLLAALTGGAVRLLLRFIFTGAEKGHHLIYKTKWTDLLGLDPQ